MMNDYYARGISAKTKAAKQTRAKQGMFLGSKAPYGYKKDPADKHHLIIDEAVADIVCRIFDMAEDGWGYFKIAKTLQAEGVPNPQSYADGTHDTRWHITSVQKILQNPVYCGDLVQGRRGNRTMHGKQIQKPESEWIIVENTHEPLVSREQWDTVQKQMKSRKRSMKNGEVQMFAGLMDFNQSFLAYDTIDGANCQTVYPKHQNQREAAVEAVRKIGLRQIRDVNIH